MDFRLFNDTFEVFGDKSKGASEEEISIDSSIQIGPTHLVLISTYSKIDCLISTGNSVMVVAGLDIVMGSGFQVLGSMF